MSINSIPKFPAGRMETPVVFPEIFRLLCGCPMPPRLLIRCESCGREMDVATVRSFDVRHHVFAHSLACFCHLSDLTLCGLLLHQGWALTAYHRLRADVIHQTRFPLPMFPDCLPSKSYTLGPEIHAEIAEILVFRTFGQGHDEATVRSLLRVLTREAA